MNIHEKPSLLSTDPLYTPNTPSKYRGTAASDAAVTGIWI
jgi:hypothetical protein